ncbi:hypothetical protein ACSQ67_007506 [Phaseolus vulgaris]
MVAARWWPLRFQVWNPYAAASHTGRCCLAKRICGASRDSGKITAMVLLVIGPNPLPDSQFLLIPERSNFN